MAQPKQRQPVTVYTCLAGPWSCSQQTEDELSATLSTQSHSRVEKYTTVNTDKRHQTVHSHNRLLRFNIRLSQMPPSNT